MNMDLNVIEAPSAEERLASLLTRRLGSRIRDLRIVFQPDGMILHGRTSTYHVKQLAQHAAMTTVNIPILANEIEVHSLPSKPAYFQHQHLAGDPFCEMEG